MQQFVSVKRLVYDPPMTDPLPAAAKASRNRPLTETRLRAAAAVLTGGLCYLALRRRKIRWYGGLDLRSDAGWREIAGAIAAMTGAALG